MKHGGKQMTLGQGWDLKIVTLLVVGAVKLAMWRVQLHWLERAANV